MGLEEKVFVYISRTRGGRAELLVFASLDEPGYEVPKGSVEPGESLEMAVHREVYEESGIKDLKVIQELGKTQWGNEEQYFFLVEAPSDVADSFEHQVTGEDIDRGFRYQYRWLEIGQGLEERLVQGCNRFVSDLLTATGE
jgi:8-oxo-dGTP pyrophosphatase MutT (NUDIX family)